MKTPIVFSAVRDYNFDNSFEVFNATLKFNHMVANMGNGFDSSNGLFRAPRKGLYHFNFSGTTRYLNDSLSVFVYKNNQIVLTIEDNANHQAIYHNNISYDWYLVLDNNDQVHLEINSGSLDVNSVLKVYFSGTLVYAVWQ